MNEPRSFSCRALAKSRFVPNVACRKQPVDHPSQRKSQVRRQRRQSWLVGRNGHLSDLPGPCAQVQARCGEHVGGATVDLAVLMISLHWSSVVSPGRGYATRCWMSGEGRVVLESAQLRGWDDCHGQEELDGHA